MSQPRMGNIEECRLQIVAPEDGWILERLARKLVAKLPYAEFAPWRPSPSSTASIAYYVNHALYEVQSKFIDVGYFTHLDEEHQFLERVSPAKLWAHFLPN